MVLGNYLKNNMEMGKRKAQAYQRGGLIRFIDGFDFFEALSGLEYKVSFFLFLLFLLQQQGLPLFSCTFPGPLCPSLSRLLE